MIEKLDVTLTINGRDYPIQVEPRKTLVDAIRDDCGQTGTHIGCEHGICGTWPRAKRCTRCSRRSSRITACSAASARPAS